MTGENRVEKVMTRAPHTIGVRPQCRRRFGLMREFGISHVPVLEGGKLAGMVSIRRYSEKHLLAPATPNHRRHHWRKTRNLGIAVKGIMDSPAVTVDAKTSLVKTLKNKCMTDDVSFLCVVSAIAWSEL